MSDLIPCPLCSRRLHPALIENHAALCSPPKPSSSGIRKHRKTRPSRLAPISRPFSTTTPKRLSPPSMLVPGLLVFPNVFSRDEDDSLVNLVEAAPPQWRDLRHRYAKNYGPPYDLARRRFLTGPAAPKATSLPAYAESLVLCRLRQLHPMLKAFTPNQLAVNRYDRTSHILPHNDCENARIITAVVGICLRATCTMTFILRARDSALSKELKHDICLPRGCVYIMSADALHVWHHAIFDGNITDNRISLTFRDVVPHVDAIVEVHAPTSSPPAAP